MISKLSLVAFALIFLCIYAKPSNPGASFDQVSFHFILGKPVSCGGEICTQQVSYSTLNLKSDEKGPHFGYLGFKFLVA